MAAKTQVAVSRPAPGVSALERARLFWAGRNLQQRIYLGAGLAVTLGTAIFFARIMSAPEYKLLMSGLDPADAQAITAELTAKKIPFIVTPDGSTIKVAADQLDAARLEIASHDATSSGHIGFEIFDKVSWGQTEFDEKVNYQRALEGELERTIQTMHNVKSARVHLVMANDSVFVDKERPAKASVTLRLRGGSLTRAEISQISRLVAGAVDNLKPADVVIIDADSNQSLGSGSDPDQPDSLDQELTRRLMATLTPVVGADHLRATVNVEYENGSSEENQEKYDPTVSVTLNMQRSEDLTGPGAGVGGIPGTSSNVAAAKPAPAPPVTPVPTPGAPKDAATKDAATKDAAAAPANGTPPSPGSALAAATATSPSILPKDGGQSSKTESATYGVNRTTRHTIEPAGSIRRLTAAVLLDDVTERKQEKGKWVETHHKRSADELKTIGDIAQAAIGFNAARGDVISVQNLTFEHPIAQELPPPTFAEKALKGVNNYSAALRYVGLLALFGLIYMTMFRPIQRRALAPPDPALMAAATASLAEPDAAAVAETAASLAARSQALRKQLADFVKAEPESSTNAVRAWLREGNS